MLPFIRPCVAMAIEIYFLQFHSIELRPKMDNHSSIYRIVAFVIRVDEEVESKAPHANHTRPPTLGGTQSSPHLVGVHI